MEVFSWSLIGLWLGSSIFHCGIEDEEINLVFDVVHWSKKHHWISLAQSVVGNFLKVWILWNYKHGFKKNWSHHTKLYILSLYYRNMSIWTNYYVWNMMILYYIAIHYMGDFFSQFFHHLLSLVFALQK
jgi:hypothetical protein